MSKRGRRERTDEPQDWRPWEDGMAGTDFAGDDGVTINVTGSVDDGTRSAVILPRSVTRLTGDARARARDLQRAGAELMHVAARIDDLVLEARDAGASWSVIGWCLGTTGEAARQRWGDR